LNTNRLGLINFKELFKSFWVFFKAINIHVYNLYQHSNQLFQVFSHHFASKPAQRIADTKKKEQSTAFSDADFESFAKEYDFTKVK